MELKKSSFLAAINEAKTVKQMAEDFGISQADVRYAAKSWGINLRKKPIKGKVTLVDDTTEPTNNTTATATDQGYVNHPNTAEVADVQG